MKLVGRQFFVTLVTLFCTVAADAADSEFVGTWQNTNANTNGIVKIIIDGNQHIRAFGACTPNPCDYGAVNFPTYGRDVSDAKNHQFGTGHWIFDFKEVLLTAKLTNPRTMSVDDFNHFTDKSNRQNYWMSATFHKVSNSF